MADINFSEEQLNAAVEEIMTELTRRVEDETQKKTLLMRQAAAKFLLVAKQNQQRMKDLEQRAKQLKKKREEIRAKIGNNPEKSVEETAIKEYNDYKSQFTIQGLQKDEFQDFFQQVLIFNEKILALLEGKQLISVVVEGTDGPVILDLTLQEFFERGGKIKADTTKTGKLSGRLNLHAIETQKNLSMALKGDKVLNNQALDELTATYKEAKADYQKHSPYAFWKVNKTDNDWNRIKIAGGLGDIAQAYSMFAHTYGPQTKAFSTFYSNLDIFFTEGVAKVDNISGLYTSDVTINGYSLAVKAANASLPGFRQMITLAQDILKEKVPDFNSLKKRAEKRKGFKDGVKKKADFGLRNKIDKVLNITEKQQKINIKVKF